jgi:hypothetical protein
VLVQVEEVELVLGADGGVRGAAAGGVAVRWGWCVAVVALEAGAGAAGADAVAAAAVAAVVAGVPAPS